MSEEYGESCPECGFNQKDEDERDQKVIDEFLDDLKSIPTFDHDVQMFIVSLKEKWEKRKTQ
jgi:hypothetical protein